MSEKISLNVSGMKCGGCESAVSGKVGAIAGVISVRPMHKENKVDVEFDETKTNQDEIIRAITEAGYTVE